MNALELRQKRAGLINEAREIINRANTESRDLSAEESEQWDRMHADADQMKAQIDRMERQESADAEMRQSTGRLAGGLQEGPAQEPRDDSVTSDAFRNYVNHQFPEDEPRDALSHWMKTGLDLRGRPQRVFDFTGGLYSQREYTPILREFRNTRPELRAQSTALTEGGDTIPEEFRRVFEQALLYYGGMRQINSTVIRTTSGAPLPMPTTNDTSNKGAILAENTKADELDIPTDRVILNAYKYTSYVVRVSYELMQDSAFDVASWVSNALGERIGRILNEHFTVGSGVDEPRGIVPAAQVGETASAAAAISPADLIELEHSVDISYRGRAQWMFHDSTLKALKLLEADNNVPIWLPGLAVREPDTILGRRYVINNDMPELGTGNRTVLFGDFSKYFIRDVMDLQLIRMDEHYAEWAQVAFVAFSRHDGDLLDAGTGPVKALVQA